MRRWLRTVWYVHLPIGVTWKLERWGRRARRSVATWPRILTHGIFWSTLFLILRHLLSGS